MMRSLRWLVALIVAFAAVPAALAAQAPTTVTGTVTSAETGEPLPGITVMVQGTAIGTLTDGQGRYTVNVPAGSNMLTFTSLAYGDETVAITGDVVNVALNPEAIALEGVVVTALGLEQQARSISTSVAELDSEEFTDVPEANIINALAGEVAGVTTIGAGPQGGSARIIIRGATSLSGNNQPLFIVDGIPIDNSAPDNGGFGGFDYGNAAADINPADIASVTVLKGPNAAALYGSRAANGVILITTKDGSSVEDTRITVNSTTTFEDPLKLPEYQNLYGQGLFGEFAFADGRGGGTWDGVDESWGPRLDAGEMIPQWNSNGEPAPWVSNPSNVESFWETGLTTYNNVAVAASPGNSTIRLSLSNRYVDGMYPGQELENWTVALNGGTEVGERLSVDGSVNFFQREGSNRPGTGYDFRNPMLQLTWFGRQVDMDEVREAYFNNPDVHTNWNYSFHTNPYWMALKNQNLDDRTRVIGNIALNYELTDWLTATARTGTDWYQDDRKRTWYADNINLFYAGFAEDHLNRNETNTDVLLTASRDLTSAVTLNATVGGNHRYREDTFNNLVVDELNVPGVFNTGNSARPVRTFNYLEQRASNSLYGKAQIGYNNYLFVDVTGRNDWSSTLPEENNSYFYPSVSGSFIFTDVFDLGNEFLSFGKVRASWARVGDDADPYQLRAVYNAASPFNGVPGFSVPSYIANADLKPEQTEAWEVGTQLTFLNNRLGIEATYYDQITRDQIIATEISAASGFGSQVVNAGAIANRGVEFRLTATPVQLNNGFSWDMSANYSNNESEVVELFGDLQTYTLGSYWGVTTEARVGDPYGSMYGEAFLRDENGRILVSDEGYPLEDPERQFLGNFTPDWLGSLSNTFRYKGAEFSFLLDRRQGGEIFSVTNMFGNYAGVLTTSLLGREDDVCEPGVVVDGIVQSTGEENANTVCPLNYFGELYYMDEPHVYDASYTKLREMRLGYTFPSSILDHTPFSALNVALVGRNLWLWTDTPNIDPETAFSAGNSQGFEFGQLPSARSIGFSVSVTP